MYIVHGCNSFYPSYPKIILFAQNTNLKDDIEYLSVEVSTLSHRQL